MLTQEDLVALQGMFGGLGRSVGTPAPMDRRYAVTSGAKEVISEPVYDRVNIATAVPASISFFTQGISASVTLIRAGATATVAKTYRDTNLQTSGVLLDRAIDVRAIQIILIPLQHAAAGGATNDISDDKATLYEAGWLDLVPSSKPRFRTSLAPFAFLDPDTSSTPATTTHTFSRGPVGGMMLSLGEDAILIEKGTPFALTVYFDGAPTLVQTFDMQIFLWGYKERPVQ